MEIPGYKIEKLIAEGGMADVYLAIQKSLERRVALKLLQKFVKPEQSERFLNEGRMIASLYHRNIITIHDVGVVDRQHYISMEYLEGGDLETRIRKGVDPETAIDILVTIGHCLALVHSKDIIHRDIKAANILFREDETPVLTDFGIAKQLNNDTNLTLDGTAMGSPDYLSPEQAECKELDGRADIYSLGIVFYEMLTGKKPYQGNSYIEIVMKHIRAPIPTLPKHLERYQLLLERLIAKEKEDRFESAEEMVDYIERFFRTPHRRGLWLRLVDFFRQLFPARPDTRQPAKTLQMTAEELNKIPTSTELADAYLAELAEQRIRKRKRVVTASIAGVMTLAIGVGIGWFAMQSTDEEVIAQQKPLVKQDKQAVLALKPGETAPIEEEAAPVTQKRTVQQDVVEAFSEDESIDDLFIEPKQDHELERYLSLASSALKKYKLTSPKNDNAYFYYEKVLAISPGHAQAKKGMTDIANRYANLAQVEIDRYDYEKAKQYVDKGLRIKPRHKRLLALKDRTNAVTDIPSRWIEGIGSIFD